MWHPEARVPACDKLKAWKSRRLLILWEMNMDGAGMNCKGRPHTILRWADLLSSSTTALCVLT